MYQLQTSSRKNSDPLSMNDFWLEVENIKQMQGSDGEESSSSEPSTPEEGEAEADWLQDTGLSPLIGDHNPTEDNVLILSTLTRTQTLAVQRRLDSYSQSLRKRSKQPARDVREVFNRASKTDIVVEQNGMHARNGITDTNGFTENSTKSPSSLHRPSGGSNIYNMDVAYSEQAVFGHNENCKTAWQPESLPHFQIQKGRLGVTRVSDLSSSDMKQVPAFALIELTALYDVLELDLKRNKPAKRRPAESRLFGVSLAALLEQDRKLITNTQVPLLLQAILNCLEKNGLELQGILRVCGSQARMKSLQQRLEKNFYAGLFSWDEVNPHDAAGLLKLFLRELPAPLLTAEYLPAFAAVQKITDLKQRLQALNLLILVLPEANRSTLKALLEFLRKVASHEKGNLMSLWNIATIMAPNLFLYRGSGGKSQEGGEKQQAEGVAALVMAMVHYQDLLWKVPTFLLSQVRKLNESSSKRFNERRLLNFLRKMNIDKERPEKNHTEPCKQVKIRASIFVKDSLAIQLNEATQAADVLKKFQEHVNNRSWQMVSTMGLIKCNSSFALSNLELYEVGGNIGEHCLDPDTYLLDLYNANPNGEWVIKPSPPSTPTS
ncbi:rho GTPase-activating protein 40 isoform X2 [Bufo gargarizans]|nr:rho GTPase-activating protein 40 isoform X2 [Bufo gargarizans]XP_044153849.1 rho GTPase-activating protein 40 isoform X2 [Bufo gargarizans]XP_044153850.1 rho GTPase-activating protein 40 isoform X2 [Bufo gargarizans]